MRSLGAPESLLSEQARQFRLSPTLAINELVQERLSKGQSVIHLGFGEATFPVQKDVLAAHRASSDLTSYLPVAGLIKLREAIARFQTRRLGSEIKAEQVVVAPGSKPLLFALFDIFNGDVLLPRPSWVSYEPQVIHAGKRVFWVETDEENRHTITGSSLREAYEKAVTEDGDPRIMLINSPSNPTGAAFDESTVKMISKFCEDRGIVLISDEIYSDIYFEDDANISVCSGNRFNTGLKVLTGGLSKTYSAGGWRVGFAIFPSNVFGETVQKAILAYSSECWSAASAPAQAAAAVAFDTTPEMDLYRRQVARLHKTCTVRLYKALRDCGLAVAAPRGSFYVYPSFHPYSKQLEAIGVRTSLELSHWLTENFGIAALPGSAFGEDDAGLAGGRYRLRMATSYLYFPSEQAKYEQGYNLLASEGMDVELPLLDDAINAIQKAVQNLKSVGI